MIDSCKPVIQQTPQEINQERRKRISIVNKWMELREEEVFRGCLVVQRKIKENFLEQRRIRRIFFGAYFGLAALYLFVLCFEFLGKPFFEVKLLSWGASLKVLVPIIFVFSIVYWLIQKELKSELRLLKTKEADRKKEGNKKLSEDEMYQFGKLVVEAHEILDREIKLHNEIDTQAIKGLLRFKLESNFEFIIYGERIIVDAQRRFDAAWRMIELGRENEIENSDPEESRINIMDLLSKLSITDVFTGPLQSPEPFDILGSHYELKQLVHALARKSVLRQDLSEHEETSSAST